MSSSEQSSSSESDNDSIPDIHKLQPYDLEPEIASSDVSTTTSDENTSSSDSEIADYSRIGNTNIYNAALWDIKYSQLKKH